MLSRIATRNMAETAAAPRRRQRSGGEARRPCREAAGKPQMSRVKRDRSAAEPSRRAPEVSRREIQGLRVGNLGFPGSGSPR